MHDYRYLDGGSEPAVGPPQDPGSAGYCLSVRREPLDQILVQRAAPSPTVEVAEKTRFVGLLHEGDRVVGARLATETGERTVRTRIVVGADGRRSSVARAVGAVSEVADPAIRALFYRYVRGFAGPSGGPANGAEFSVIEDEVAYVFPSDAGLTCVAISLNRLDYAREKTTMDAYVAARLPAHRGLVDRVAAATPVGKLLGSGPQPSWVRAPYGPGWALVGDAGSHQDPWTGVGMDFAGTHATFLAEALLDWFGGTTGEDAAMATYHTRRNEHTLPTYRQTIEVGRDLRRPAPAGTA